MRLRQTREHRRSPSLPAASPKGASLKRSGDVKGRAGRAVRRRGEPSAVPPPTRERAAVSGESCPNV